MDKLKALFILVQKGYAKKIIDVLIGKEFSALTTNFFADGIKKEYISDVLGVDKKREVIFTLINEKKYKSVYTFLNNRFSFEKAMKGMLLTFDVTSIAGITSYKFLVDYERSKNMGEKIGESSNELLEVTSPKEKALAIFCIINIGFADIVMEAAIQAGARGGTILNARGTGNKGLEKAYGIVISPEKEIIVIVVRRDIGDKVLSAINEKAGLNTRGQGIAFTLPVNDYIGVNLYESK